MMKPDANIVLTGFMATGKSTVGALVAQALGRPFVDMDALIEMRTGWAIPELFGRFGEPHFRAIERGLCFELAVQNGLVVATGGGALVDDASREVLTRCCWVACLSADEAEIERRLSLGDNRPLASQWRPRLAQRQAMYASLPHQIQTTHKTPEILAQEVIELWNKTTHSAPL